MIRRTWPTTCAPTSPGFSEGARDVIDHFGFDPQITRLDRDGILYKVLAKFADVDLHPDKVSDEQIAQITRLYGEFTEGDHVKVFPTHHFGFMRITVERPLRVRWEINQDTLEAVEGLPEVQKLEEAAAQDALLDRLLSMSGWTATNRSEAERLLKDGKETLKPGAVKKIVAALTIKDEAADPILDGKGRAEPDPDLRDNENVPLPPVELRFDHDPTERLASEPYRAAVVGYVKEEVLPWVPDAWVDHDKSKLGFEIPFTREFYVYTPPRPLSEIDAEIETLEQEILRLLRGEGMTPRRLRHLASNPVVQNVSRDLPYVALEHIESGTGRLLRDVELRSKVDQQATVFRPGDVLFGKLRPYLHKVLHCTADGISSGELLVLRPQRRNPRFLYYLALSRRMVQWGEATSYGVKMPRTSWEALRTLEVIAPDAGLQASIADFLDRETERIDLLMDKKRRLIGLLEEKRTALITQAVTQGLDPSAPMKDSGVAWFDKDPDHWEVVALRRLTLDVQTGPFGSQLHAHDYVSDRYPVVNPANLVRGRIVPNFEMTVDDETRLRLEHHTKRRRHRVWSPR